MIENILFDLGGVLLKLDREACIKSFTQIGFKNFGEILGDFVQDGFFLDFEKGLFDSYEFRKRVRTYIDTEVSDKDIDMAMKSFLVEIPKDRLDYIASLKGKYGIYMLSNTNPIAVDIVREYFHDCGHDMDSLFDKLYLSYELKSAKPDPEIYKKVIADGKFNPAKTLFIDDSEKNLEVASSLGINVLLINQLSDFSKEIGAVL